MAELNKNRARARLAVPRLAMLPKVADSLSFLYLDIVRIVQDDTGVCAQIERPRGTDVVYLPTAALSCVLLGPGTSITAPALTTLARHGTTVICVGSGVVRAYAGILPDSLTTSWLERQVRAWADDTQRLRVARAMYETRFGTDALEPRMTLQQLRGLEGHRMKALYRHHAANNNIGRFKRNYNPDSWEEQDPVNLALSAANVCLYGVVHAAVLALGCSPALGFIHTGAQHSFIYDIADLYKAELTIPTAFAVARAEDPEAAARRRLREGLRLFRLLPRIVADLQTLLDPDRDTAEDTSRIDVPMVDLWDPRRGAIPAGVNYAETNDEPSPPTETDPE
jgi:CRISPR-associated protein Cas1